jgi:hypothetical protein
LKTTIIDSDNDLFSYSKAVVTCNVAAGAAKNKAAPAAGKYYFAV